MIKAQKRLRTSTCTPADQHFLLCLTMASSRPTSTENLTVSDDEEDILSKALPHAEGFETASRILDAASDQVGNTTSKLHTFVRQATVSSTFLAKLIDLTAYVDKAIPVVQPVCEVLFDFIEWVLMKYLTRDHGSIYRDITSIKQAFPAEWAQIDTILKFVKKEMEDISNEFNEAMSIVKMAVRYNNATKSAKVLKRYKSIRSNIHPVFDTCLEYITRAQDILKKLNPEIANLIGFSRHQAVQSTAVATLVASMATLVSTGGLLFFAAPALLLTASATFGFSILQRREFLNAVAHYNTEVGLIMKIERMKKQLAEGQSFLEIPK